MINVDVAELPGAVPFYKAAFGFNVGRRIGDSVVELLGAGVPLYLLERKERNYERHWGPVHLDGIVDDMDAALARAKAAGAIVETDVKKDVWGSNATLSDPYGNGVCVVHVMPPASTSQSTLRSSADLVRDMRQRRANAATGRELRDEKGRLTNDGVCEISRVPARLNSNYGAGGDRARRPIVRAREQ